MRIYGQFALVYILAGDAFYQDVNGLKKRVCPGDLIVVFPELGHAYGPKAGTNWSTIWISFAGPLFDLWQTKGLLNVKQPIHHLRPINRWYRQFESFSKTFKQAGPMSQLSELVRLQTLLVQILTLSNRDTLKEKEPDWLLKACDLLESKLDKQVSWKEVARSLGMGDENFRKKFTSFIGHPPSQYRINRRIDKACQLMIEQKLSNKQVAETLGFCDEFYFSRCFRLVMGKSPRSFRQHYG